MQLSRSWQSIRNTSASSGQVTLIFRVRSGQVIHILVVKNEHMYVKYGWYYLSYKKIAKVAECTLIIHMSQAIMLVLVP